MTVTLRVIAVALVCATCATGARAELIDGIDIERRGNEALINILFTVPIGFLRHMPADSGDRLRIYPDLQPGGSGAAIATARRTLRLPQTDMVPQFTVTYPESDGALLIEFERATRFEIVPHSHGVTVTVPVLPGARDWVVITRDWSVSPDEHAAEVRGALTASVVEATTGPAPQPPEVPVVFQSGVQLTGFAGGGGGSYNLRVDSMKQVRFGTVVRQEQDWSCGSAALATLLTYHYNHPMSEAEALEAMFARGNQDKIRREGFSLLDIKIFLEALGYQANGFEASLDRLARVNVPAIVIVNDSGYNHFVVVKGLRHGSVLLGDPAKGNHVVSRGAFEQMWENKIVFVITSRREGVAFNFSEDWRFVSAPLGDAVSRDSLGARLITRPGPNDF
jgi:uncharacterized protein